MGWLGTRGEGLSLGRGPGPTFCRMQNRTCVCPAAPARGQRALGLLQSLSPQCWRQPGKLSEQQISCFWLVSEHRDHAINAWIRPMEGFAGDGALRIILMLQKPPEGVIRA